MTWILIISITTFYGGGSVATQEFNTEQACQFAGKHATEVFLKNKHFDKGSILFVCEPKG